MVNRSWPEFTINIICHDDVELMRHVLPHNLAQLRDHTRRSLDVVMTVDGAEDAPREALLQLAAESGVDEVRMRQRTNNCASGDASNNGHLHAFSDKTRYLLTIEADVAIFLTDPQFDLLDACAEFFARHPNRPLLHRMDDSDCWVWKLEKVAPDIEPGVWSVNRISSHFLVYDTMVLRGSRGYPNLTAYQDDHSHHYNFEDELSHFFAEPTGPGIAFPHAWPLRIYHCDRKQSQGSLYYSKLPDVKLQVFKQRRAEVAGLAGRC
jgi:hypothetical protein